jgi:hypothetical protein
MYHKTQISVIIIRDVNFLLSAIDRTNGKDVEELNNKIH